MFRLKNVGIIPNFTSMKLIQYPEYRIWISDFNNFLEYEVGDVIFEEYPALCIPRDRDYACFHCALPLESINEAASRLSKNKHELFEMMPMNKK